MMKCVFCHYQYLYMYLTVRYLGLRRSRWTFWPGILHLEWEWNAGHAGVIIIVHNIHGQAFGDPPINWALGETSRLELCIPTVSAREHHHQLLHFSFASQLTPRPISQSEPAVASAAASPTSQWTIPQLRTTPVGGVPPS